MSRRTAGGCDADSTGHPPLLYLLILLNLLIYALVAIIVRKRATIEIGLCGTSLEPPLAQYPNRLGAGRALVWH